MKGCLICGLKKDYPICKTCDINPFKIEHCRQILADLGDLETLKKMYSLTPEIKDLNTAIFWNKKLNKINSFEEQDNMTKERVITAISYIPKTAKKILDVGAGYGFLEELITKKHYKYDIYGFDISSDAIENLKKRFIGEFIVGSIYKPSYSSGIFDAVIALEILEHIPPSKIFKVISGLKRLLSSNGILIVSVPLNEGLMRKKNNSSGHVREYTSNLIKSELLLAGFRSIRYKELYAFKNLYSFKKFLRRTMFHNRWKPNDIVIQASKL